MYSVDVVVGCSVVLCVVTFIDVSAAGFVEFGAAVVWAVDKLVLPVVLESAAGTTVEFVPFVFAGCVGLTVPADSSERQNAINIVEINFKINLRISRMLYLLNCGIVSLSSSDLF